MSDMTLTHGNTRPKQIAFTLIGESGHWYAAQSNTYTALVRASLLRLLAKVPLPRSRGVPPRSPPFRCSFASATTVTRNSRSLAGKAYYSLVPPPPPSYSIRVSIVPASLQTKYLFALRRHVSFSTPVSPLYNEIKLLAVCLPSLAVSSSFAAAVCARMPEQVSGGNKKSRYKSGKVANTIINQTSLAIVTSDPKFTDKINFIGTEGFDRKTEGPRSAKEKAKKAA
ncbi:hypothetical protein CVT26_004095, partial [Gymnopilus dilepis]